MIPEPSQKTHDVNDPPLEDFFEEVNMDLEEQLTAVPEDDAM